MYLPMVQYIRSVAHADRVCTALFPKWSTWWASRGYHAACSITWSGFQFPSASIMYWDWLIFEKHASQRNAKNGVWPVQKQPVEASSRAENAILFSSLVHFVSADCWTGNGCERKRSQVHPGTALQHRVSIRKTWHEKIPTQMCLALLYRLVNDKRLGSE